MPIFGRAQNSMLKDQIIICRERNLFMLVCEKSPLYVFISKDLKGFEEEKKPVEQHKSFDHHFK